MIVIFNKVEFWVLRYFKDSRIMIIKAHVKQEPAVQMYKYLDCMM